MAVVKKTVKGGRGNYADLASLVAYANDELHVRVRWATVYLGDRLHQATQVQQDGKWSDPLCPIPVETGSGSGLTVMQQLGSALTYARRYSLCGALGIATTDDDGQTSGYRRRNVERMTDEQQATIDRILAETNTPPGRENNLLSNVLHRPVAYGTLSMTDAQQVIESYEANKKQQHKEDKQ